ncbi:MAG: hypothetical protein LIO95_01930 [Clostridiales bacterium]|nr:hypothetical protein [Clostridiales bacterium]
MSSFSRKFTIRQVTPIIHFQFGEADATLRATELKPKLDRFLCGRYRAEQGETVPEAWQIADAPGNDGRSDYYHLNYKAQMFPKGETAKIEVGQNNFPMYFGNMGDGEKKHGLFCPEGLTLKITCLISDKAQREALLTFIGENLELFFLTHNFGTRQTKGYGGFLYCPEHSLAEQLALVQKVYPRFIYCKIKRINLDVAAIDRNTEWAKSADLVCMAMKTGRNLRKLKNIEDNDIKGYLMKDYPMTDGEDKAGNDKAMMKGAFGVGLTKDGKMPEQHQPEPGEYSFKRAVLGLTDTYTFHQENGKEIRKQEDCPVITVTHTDDQTAKTYINRFPSPVLVKVLPTAVCFLPEDAGPILDKEFAFQCGEHKEVISTPAVFDTAQFLEKFVGWYNGEFPAGKFQSGSLRDRCSKIRLYSVGGEQT